MKVANNHSRREKERQTAREEKIFWIRGRTKYGGLQQRRENRKEMKFDLKDLRHMYLEWAAWPWCSSTSNSSIMVRLVAVGGSGNLNKDVNPLVLPLPKSSFLSDGDG
jgi:hypothetical protein